MHYQINHNTLELEIGLFSVSLDLLKLSTYEDNYLSSVEGMLIDWKLWDELIKQIQVDSVEHLNAIAKYQELQEIDWDLLFDLAAYDLGRQVYSLNQPDLSISAINNSNQTTNSITKTAIGLGLAATGVAAIAIAS